MSRCRTGGRLYPSLTNSMTCTHQTVHCINEYELIRKYRCEDCRGLVMCSCDQEIGERFLSHQLSHGCILETQERVPVTHGFADGICRECRGLAPEAHPMAAIPGRTSKIKRYYWREIIFLTYLRFADRAEASGLPPGSLYSAEAQELRKKVEREVIEEIKRSHNSSPKYDFAEPSQSEIIEKFGVEVLKLEAKFGPKSASKGVGILDGADVVSPEDFVARYFEAKGWEVLFCESRPFHVLFGLYLWLLIQDPADPLCQIRGFTAKMDLPTHSILEGEKVWTRLPTDFGTAGYAERRGNAIKQHIASMLVPGADSPPFPNTEQLLWLFDRWLDGSALLRDYLWAHDPEDIARARRIVEVLPPEVIVRILEYLVGNYWRRYVGWPDLLVFRDSEFFFVEVKASKDKLSNDQKRWVEDNAHHLQLPFRLVKITRSVEGDDRSNGDRT